MPAGFEVYDENGQIKIGIDAPICRVLYSVNDGWSTQNRTNVLLGTIPTEILAAGKVLFWAASNPPPVASVTGASISYHERVSYSVIDNEVYVTNSGLVHVQNITCLLGVRL